MMPQSSCTVLFDLTIGIADYSKSFKHLYRVKTIIKKDEGDFSKTLLKISVSFFLIGSSEACVIVSNFQKAIPDIDRGLLP